MFSTADAPQCPAHTYYPAEASVPPGRLIGLDTALRSLALGPPACR